LLNNSGQGLAFEVPVVIRDGDAEYWTIRVLEDVMGSGAVVNEESGSFQGADNLLGFDDG
jgi:hypothetical protein